MEQEVPGSQAQDSTTSGSSSANSRAAFSSDVTKYQAEYTVRDGDTLAIVCRMYYGNLDKLQEICDLNGITDPNTDPSGTEDRADRKKNKGT